MKRILLLLLSVYCGNLFAQTDTIAAVQTDTLPETEKTQLRVYGGFESNAQWYLNDKERHISHPDDPVRSNNYYLLNYNYGRWTAGMQMEIYEKNALLNYNPGFKGGGLGTYYLNYKTKKFDATAGYFYDQFGSGMILRAWEDRALGINTALRGGRIIYRPSDNVRLTALYGRQRTGFDVAHGDVYGFDSDFNLSTLFGFQTSDISFGASYVGRYEKIDIPNPPVDELTNAFSGRVNFTHNSFYMSGEYNYKQKDILLNALNTLNYNFIKPGNALLLNFGYTAEGLGVDLTLRRMENMGFLSERTPTAVGDNLSTSLNFNDKILSFTPALTKQHHSNLANIYVYQAQSRVSFVDPTIMMSGETGGQIDVFYDFAKGTTLGGKYGTKIAVNASSWYNLPGTYRFNPSEYETRFFGVGKNYFVDVNTEIKKRFSESWITGFEYIRQYYNKEWLQGGEPVKTHVVTAEATYNFATNKSVRFEAEHMFANADFKNWAGGTVELNFNDKYSFYVWDIVNYGNDDPDRRIHYYNVGGAYRIGATRIAMNYGRQRGGLVCVGGVCRFVPESTGLSLSVSTAF